MEPESIITQQITLGPPDYSHLVEMIWPMVPSILSLLFLWIMIRRWRLMRRDPEEKNENRNILMVAIYAFLFAISFLSAVFLWYYY